MRFEWDPKKAASNLKKHGITFQEAATAFGDPLAITFQYPDHSEDINRQDRTRIISARLMGRKERVIYEEG